MATSSTQSGFVDNWQRGKSVTECNLHMLETEDFTDVTFLVGSEKHLVRAHRYVLASRSCVFHAMFCGRMAEQREIIIPDIEGNDFRAFLRFIYTDAVDITPTNVSGLLYSSRKYDVASLFEKSTSFLEDSLTEENLCEILEESHGYGYSDLEDTALNMLQQASLQVTKSPAFLDLCSNCFETFLKSEHLNLKEEEVFEAALVWTKDECEREDLSPSHENLRKILGEMVYEIRFASLSVEFLTKVVGPSGILTAKERVKIRERILTDRRNLKNGKVVKSKIDIRPFRDDVRQSVNERVHYVTRFKLTQNTIGLTGCHEIAFSANKTITLLGCQLYGADSKQAAILDIRLYDKNRLIAHPVQDKDWTLSDPVNDVMFPDPVSIQAGGVYTICVSFSHESTVMGCGGRRRVLEAGVVFTFSQSDYGSYTTVEQGQIPALIWTLRNVIDTEEDTSSRGHTPAIV